MPENTQTSSPPSQAEPPSASGELAEHQQQQAAAANPVTTSVRENGEIDATYDPSKRPEAQEPDDPRMVLELKHGDDLHRLHAERDRDKLIEWAQKGLDYEKKTQALGEDRRKVEDSIKIADAARRAQAGSTDALREFWQLLGVEMTREQQDAYIASLQQNNQTPSGGTPPAAPKPKADDAASQHEKDLEALRKENDERYLEQAGFDLERTLTQSLDSDPNFRKLMEGGDDSINQNRRNLLLRHAWDAAVKEAERREKLGQSYNLRMNADLASHGVQEALAQAGRLGLGAPTPMGRATDTSGRGAEVPMRPPKAPGPGASAAEVEAFNAQSFAYAIAQGRRGGSA